ncbi:peptide ABC transporter permease [Williamsia sp. Leaf354]|uniref:ABC transporter permease n=1 Tax=Williamsia sp. Leaf354 TaxID=1736349 RepID=UPI0006F7425F|nr:ABC transporter permease [Williamsia sp. Leaf354]KQS00586.1 peptide ABC transporter permease [Williamsia sp. Leaf354]
MSDQLVIDTPRLDESTGARPTPRPVRRRFSPSRWGGRASVAVSGVVVLLVIGWAAVPSLFASGDPLTGTPRDKLQPPSTSHWFGTDNIGRDVYTRVVHGSQLSLSATLLAVGLALVVGSLIGLLAGAIGGAVDALLMRIVDVLLSIPLLLMSLALVTALGFGTVNVAIAVGVTMVASFARVMRSEVLRVRRAPYVEAAFAVGSRWPRVLVQHILRNACAPVIGLAAVQFGLAVLAVSALSFLGYGAKPPTPEWGSLVSEGRNYLATAWWLTTVPGLVIVAVVLSAHRLGHAVGERRS